MRALVLVPLLLAGCSSQVCALIGQYEGLFEGDAQGTVQAVVSEDPAAPEQAQMDVTLASDDGRIQLEGGGAVDCSSGELVIDLRDVGDQVVGEVTGTIDGSGGSGEWSLLSGESGTWSLN